MSARPTNANEIAKYINHVQLLHINLVRPCVLAWLKINSPRVKGNKIKINISWRSTTTLTHLWTVCIHWGSASSTTWQCSWPWCVRVPLLTSGFNPGPFRERAGDERDAARLDSWNRSSSALEMHSRGGSSEICSAVCSRTDRSLACWPSVSHGRGGAHHPPPRTLHHRIAAQWESQRAYDPSTRRAPVNL